MKTFGFVGLGLIGGSIAKGLRNIYPDCKIIACDLTIDSIQKALKDGVADIITDKIDDNFLKCNIIFLCIPVMTMSYIFLQLKGNIPEDCIITDVGSVKKYPQQKADEAGISHFFIGGHPMAGSEKSGYDNSDSKLLNGCTYILTPSEFVKQNKINSLTEILERMGCRVFLTTPELHDYAVAGISHLPHLVAAALTQTVKSAESKDKLMAEFASSGFRDTTRIAASSPEVWSQICYTNSENITKLLDDFSMEIKKIRDAIEKKDDDAIRQLFCDNGKYLKKMK